MGADRTSTGIYTWAFFFRVVLNVIGSENYGIGRVNRTGGLMRPNDLEMTRPGSLTGD